MQPRLADVPEVLRSRIERAIAQHHDFESSEVSEALRRIGERILAEALADLDRGGAITLLAADALVTYYCEAVAERAPLRLGQLERP